MDEDEVEQEKIKKHVRKPPAKKELAMGAQLRVYRRRIKSVKSTKKITKAMELIAASRIVKAQQRVAASTPYAEAITRAVSAVASFSNVDHPLTGRTEQEVDDPPGPRCCCSPATAGWPAPSPPTRSGRASGSPGCCASDGKEVVPFVVGRKGVGFYRFRHREIAGEWTGFSESPTYADAKEVADAVIEAFLTPD